MRGNARASRQRHWSVYTKRLATYCVEIREFDEVVIGKVCLIAALSLEDLRTELALHIWVHSEELKDSGERVGGCIHARENEGPMRSVLSQGEAQWSSNCCYTYDI